MEIVALEISLKQRAHLCIARTRMIQDHEMDFETGHVDKDRKYDKTCYTRAPMLGLITLDTEGQVIFYCLETARDRLTHDILRSPNLSQRSSIVYRPTRAVTKRPTSFTLRCDVIRINTYKLIKGVP